MVGIILALVALFGSRKILAGSGAALCMLAIVFTVAKQNHDVATLDKAFGHDPALSWRTSTASRADSTTRDRTQLLKYVSLKNTFHDHVDLPVF